MFSIISKYGARFGKINLHGRQESFDLSARLGELMKTVYHPDTKK